MFRGEIVSETALERMNEVLLEMVSVKTRLLEGGPRRGNARSDEGNPGRHVNGRSGVMKAAEAVEGDPPGDTPIETAVVIAGK